jgi:hypothetical protein
MRIYRISASAESREEVARLMDARPPLLNIQYDVMEETEKDVLSGETAEAKVGGRLSPRPESLYPSRLIEMLSPRFRLDFWEQTAWFCSNMLRVVLKKKGAEAQYFPVDDSLSSEEFRSKEFMMLNVLAYEDFIDVDRSEGVMRSTLDGRVIFVKQIRARDGFVPRTPLFGSPHDRRAFATEDLARSILDSGCVGISFIDLETREPLI